MNLSHLTSLAPIFAIGVGVGVLSGGVTPPAQASYRTLSASGICHAEWDTGLLVSSWGGMYNYYSYSRHVWCGLWDDSKVSRYSLNNLLVRVVSNSYVVGASACALDFNAQGGTCGMYVYSGGVGAQTLNVSPQVWQYAQGYAEVVVDLPPLDPFYRSSGLLGVFTSTP